MEYRPGESTKTLWRPDVDVAQVIFPEDQRGGRAAEVARQVVAGIQRTGERHIVAIGRGGIEKRQGLVGLDYRLAHGHVVPVHELAVGLKRYRRGLFTERHLIITH